MNCPNCRRESTYKYLGRSGEFEWVKDRKMFSHEFYCNHCKSEFEVVEEPNPPEISED